MLAFERAVRLGYRYLETDVRVTADGVVIAFHDGTLDRVCDRGGPIATTPWAEVRQATVSGERIPRLDDLLGTWPDVRINIDVKDERGVAPLVAVLERTGARDRVCIGAFSDPRIASFRRLAGEGVCTAMAPLAVARLRLASLGAPTGDPAGECAQVPSRWHGVNVIDRRFVETAHKRGRPVHAFTVDVAPEMDRLLDLGVDGIMSDRPTVLKEVLTRRGQWV